VFSGSAYNLACGSVTANSVPSWISDPATVMLAPGSVVTVPMTFRQNNPVTIGADFVPNVVEVSVGSHGTYARLADGTVYQWGLIATNSEMHVPTPVASLTNTAQVVGGFLSACARKTDGSIWCWGNDEGGQLGPGVAAGATSLTPVQVGTLTGATVLTMGAQHTCALVSGQYFCWGDNSLGQFGNGNTTGGSTPLAMSPNFGSTLVAGAGHTCAIGNLASLGCTGLNTSGQLGVGSTAANSVFYQTTVLKNVASAACGNAHTCAVMGDGSVRCFGNNANGQLGDGTTISRTTPVTVVGLANVVQVQGGSNHTCALLQNGTVSCWGSAAMLGAGAVVDQTTPVTVPGLTGVTAIHTQHSANHTCAELADRSIRCWGMNTFGQIGNGNTFFANRPTPVVF
jgi:alpha-tubulin suppressor-like RCC1 family protein